MNAIWAFIAIIVGLLFLYAVVAAVWMALQAAAVVIVVGGFFWILIKVATYFDKNKPSS